MFARRSVFVMIGTLLVVVSALMTGIFQRILNDRIENIEKKVSEINDRLNFSREHELKARVSFNTVQIMQSILQSSGGPQLPHSQSIVMLILQGIADRNTAVTGDHPSNEQLQEWEALASCANSGDPKGFQELSKTAQDLLRKYPLYTQNLVSQRQDLETRCRKLKRGVAFVLSISVTMQVLGLIAVSAKDSLPLRQ